jgi:Holliday junction resolvasome RuvABC endonuclease subunit
MSYKILGVDVGSHYTGWCVWDGTGHVASGVLTLYTKKYQRTIWERSYLLKQELHRAVGTYAPDVIGVEWPMGFGGNAAKIKLGMMLGAVGVVAGGWELTVLEVNPTEVKHTNCCKGQAGQVYAAAIAGKEKVRPDEADAMGVCLALSGKLFGLTLEEAKDQWGHRWSTR